MDGTMPLYPCCIGRRTASAECRWRCDIRACSWCILLKAWVPHGMSRCVDVAGEVVEIEEGLEANGRESTKVCRVVVTVVLVTVVVVTVWRWLYL